MFIIIFAPTTDIRRFDPANVSSINIKGLLGLFLAGPRRHLGRGLHGGATGGGGQQLHPQSKAEETDEREETIMTICKSISECLFQFCPFDVMFAEANKKFVQEKETPQRTYRFFCVNEDQSNAGKNAAGTSGKGLTISEVE